jgi:hypothetical protein
MHLLVEESSSPDAKAAVGLREIMRRITLLSQMDPTDVVELASNEETSGFFDLPIPPADPNEFLRPWNEVGRASAKPLSDQQYAAFLRGENVPDDGRTDERTDLFSLYRPLDPNANLEIISGSLSTATFIAFGLLHFLRPTHWLDEALFAGGVVLLVTLMLLLVSLRRRLNIWRRRMGSSAPADRMDGPGHLSERAR